MSRWIGLEILILKQPWKSRILPMEQIWGRNCNQIYSGAPYLVQKDQGHLVTSVFLPQGHRTRYKIIRGILDPDHPPKFWQWPWDTGHWVRSSIRRPITACSKTSSHISKSRIWKFIHGDVDFFYCLWKNDSLTLLGFCFCLHPGTRKYYGKLITSSGVTWPFS